MTIEIGSSAPPPGRRPAKGGRAGDDLPIPPSLPTLQPRSADMDARLRRAQELGGVLAFEWDARSDRIVASPAYKTLFGLKSGDSWSRSAFLACIHPDDRERLEAERRRLLATPERFEVTYRVILPCGAIRWLLSRGDNLVDEDGVVTGFAGVTMDITDRKEFEDALRRSRREALSRFRELRRLYENAPVGLALLDRDFRFLRVNALFAALNGIAPDEHHGLCIYDVLPALGNREAFLRQALIAAEPVRDLEVEAETSRDPSRRTALRMHFYPLLDNRCSLTGFGVVAQDVTAQKRAEHAQALLSRELNHRIKNLFAVISGIVTLSARGHGGLVAFGRTVRSRIDALSKAHDLARHGENGIGASPPSLKALLRTLLAPYRSDENRPDAVRISGEDLILGPHATTALALAFHEFATNAAKYGALSNVEGRLSVTCALVDDRVGITWTERGGPPVARAPKGDGFGTILARRSLVQDLGGEIRHDWASKGLTMKVSLPRESLEG
jgi:PAS domain S-box-containing protein